MPYRSDATTDHQQNYQSQPEQRWWVRDWESELGFSVICAHNSIYDNFTFDDTEMRRAWLLVSPHGMILNARFYCDCVPPIAKMILISTPSENALRDIRWPIHTASDVDRLFALGAVEDEFIHTIAATCHFRIQFVEFNNSV